MGARLLLVLHTRRVWGKQGSNAPFQDLQTMGRRFPTACAAGNFPPPLPGLG